jgi:hypothetical protein
MIVDVKHHLQSRPFEPFAIVTSAGQRYPVPSPEHAGIHPRGHRVLVWLDDGAGITISGLHIASVEKDAPKKRHHK